MEKKAATEIDYNVVEQNNPVCKEHSTSSMLWSYPPILENFYYYYYYYYYFTNTKLDGSYCVQNNLICLPCSKLNFQTLQYLKIKDMK